MLPSILNVFSMQSFLILNCIIGGQALAAVSNKLNDTLGIVIIALISFAVSFFFEIYNIFADRNFYSTNSLCLFLSRLPFADTDLYTGTCFFIVVKISFKLKKRFPNRFENFAWIPNVIALPVLLGLAGRHLDTSTFLAVPPSSAAQIISFGSVVASAIISWCPITQDCGVYHDAEAST